MNGTILVTGATGFVGAAVARCFLDRGYRLRLLVREGSDRRNIDGLDAEIVVGDLRVPDTLRDAVRGCRYVAHVAADYRIFVRDPAAMFSANVDGTVALLRAAHAAGVERICYCSSVAALGLTRDHAPADEETPNTDPEGAGVYKASKYRAEQAVLRLVQEEGVPAVIVNPSAPVGPRDIKPTPTGAMIRDAAAGRMPAYTDTGINLVHVDDVAMGHALALERGRIGERYILAGENLAMRDVLALVDGVAGRSRRRLRVPVAALWPVAVAAEHFSREPIVTRDHLRMARKTMFFTAAKARDELGFTARPAREAVADAVAWFRAQ